MDKENQQTLEEILSIVKELDRRVSNLEGHTSCAQPILSADKKISLREFILSRAPSNAVQMTLTIAQYLETYDGVSPFNAADLEQGFRAARETVPPNINDKANMCVKNGYFMEDKTKKNNMKTWVVTRTGEEAVQKGFGKMRS